MVMCASQKLYRKIKVEGLIMTEGERHFLFFLFVFCFFVFLVFFFLSFRAVPAAYGDSQARG